MSDNRPMELARNADGISLKGCHYIYAPAGQAGEYAALAANPYRGCGHACAYCYVPLVTKQPRVAFDAGAVWRKNYLRAFTADAISRANYLKEITRTTDWRGYTLRMIDVLNRVSAKHYIKKDLQAYLPSGYPNPLRVLQHHGFPTLPAKHSESA